MDNTVKNQLNLKDLAGSIATQILGYTCEQATKAYGPVFIEWAKKYGANFKDDEPMALDILSRMLPVPQRWPSLEVTTSGKMATTGDAPPKTATRKSTTPVKKASEYPLLELQDGVKPPGCPALKKSGSEKGKPCGKECRRALPEHDPGNNPQCRELKCGHLFCGTHIGKAGSEENEALAKLEASADPSKQPVVVGEGGSQVQISNNILSAQPEDTSGVNSAVMNKLLEKVRAQVSANNAAQAAKGNDE
jgi:hypothetical protein